MNGQHEARYDVFISYRRGDADELALLLQRTLQQHGATAFLDRDLRSGVFDDVLLRQIAESPAFLIILTPNCLDRCSDEEDWLRKEICQAISSQRNIIPLKTNAFQFTAEVVRSMDPAIRELARYQAVEYSRAYFESTIERILTIVTEDKAEREVRAAKKSAIAPAAEKSIREQSERRQGVKKTEGASLPSKRDVSPRRLICKWGTVITLCYCLILVVLLVPGLLFLFKGTVSEFLSIYKRLGMWIPVGILVGSQALLLFLSVDTSMQRLKPRAHILVSCLLTGTFLALLMIAAILCFGSGIYSDEFLKNALDGRYVFAWMAAIWLIWLIVFYFFSRNSDSNGLITRSISWLLKGSVLELLVAVPCHVIVRRRHDCSAPVATSLGITTGLAIMLMSFGPSVLLLYRKRLGEYPKRKSTAK